MQGVDNPVASFFRRAFEASYAQQIFTYLHPYTLGCYTGHRLLMRIKLLTSYPPISVTSFLRNGGPYSSKVEAIGKKARRLGVGHLD